ncbi:MAG: MBL fold metallo-hydrolase [Lachnospiraceae bacterium]|nr:MBL fold metallo-hydrolase [Lachnospiraceae bacterium]
MRFISFASSSKGNCALISHKNTNVLVDCGISRKRIVDSLNRYNLGLEDIDCIFITHSHTDHILGLQNILKDYDIKIVSQRDTLINIANSLEKNNIKVNLNNFKIVSPINILNDNSYLSVGDIKFYPIKGCHDVPSLYYKFVLGDTVIAILTDMGKYTEYNLRTLEDVNYLMLECNYDSDMLLENSYPAILKDRIMGEGGHLSNVDCSNIILNIAGSNLKEVYLSHISADSNSEEYAYEFVTKYIKDNYKTNSNLQLPNIKVAKRQEITEIINNLED